MNQSKLESFVETCLNTALGFIVSFTAWPLVAALFGLPYSVEQNLAITSIFTALSIARGYVVRRWFNAGLNRAAAGIARRLYEFIAERRIDNGGRHGNEL